MPPQSRADYFRSPRPQLRAAFSVHISSDDLLGAPNCLWQRSVSKAAG
jgi:hypothetical protein